MAKWSDLCNDILKLIIDEFSAIEDIVHFGAVCRPWRPVSVEKLHLSTVYPLLMLAEKEDSDRRGFYSLSTQKVYDLDLPEARGRRCWSSQGWLITLGFDLEIHLLNPFSRVQIRLPPQPTLPCQYCLDDGFTPEELRNIFIQKVVLSSRPSPSSVKSKTAYCGEVEEECVAMAISSQFRKLAFLRLGDEVWTAVDSGDEKGFDDVIYFNGQFYAIKSSGSLFICDISGLHPKTIVFAEPEESVRNHVERAIYLVESLGELFMVIRDIIPLFGEYDDEDADGSTTVFDYKTTGFDVFKFNFDNRKWTKVKSLDNRAFFVGNNNSSAIFPSNQHQGCEPNSIYFTDSYQDNLCDGAGKDMGMFRMETGEIESHYVGPDFFSHFCTPLWISADGLLVRS